MNVRLFVFALVLFATIACDALAQRVGGGAVAGQPFRGGFGGNGMGGWNAMGQWRPNHHYGGYGGYGYGGYGGYGRRGYGGGFGGLSMSLNLTPLIDGQAAINYQAAYHQFIQNQLLRTQTYFDMKRMNASYKAEQAMMHPPATPEQLREFSQARLPAPLSPNEFDPGKGVIEWPGVLTRKEFDEMRGRLEGLFSDAAADPHGSGMGTQNCRDIQHEVDEMDAKLHSEIAEFKPGEYIAASKFLKSLALHAQSPGANALAKQ